MCEDTWEIHKEMLTCNFQEVALQVKEEELELYIIVYPTALFGF